MDKDQTTLEQITSDLNAEKDNASPKEHFDDEASAEESRSGFGVQYDKRDEQYTNLLKNYTNTYSKKSAVNAIYKDIFFYVTIVLLCALVVFPITLLFIIASKESSSLSDVSVVLGSITGIVSSIIVLPKIIAEHLFPVNEDSNMIDLVKTMQQNDTKIRNTPIPLKPNTEKFKSRRK